MASLLRLPQQSDAFSQYRPSKNAHVDLLSANDASKSDTAKDVKVIKLVPRVQAGDKSSRDDLGPLLASIGPILRGEQTVQSFHHLSAACHRLVLPPFNNGPDLYSTIESELKDSIATLVRSWRGAIMAREPDFLDRFVLDWKAWEDRVALLTAIFVYLDRIFANGQQIKIRNLSIRLFSSGVWSEDIVRGKIRDDILAWVSDERETASANDYLRSTINVVTRLSKLLKTYDSLSEPYVALANTYYSDHAESNMASVESASMSPSKYVSWALEKVTEERERAHICMDPSVAKQVVHVVRVQCGYKMSKRIVRRALDEAMDLSDVEALGRLYGFTVDVDVFGDFVTSLQTHIEERLRKVISDPANDAQMIEQTLKLKRFADQSVASLFSSESTAEEEDEDGRESEDGEDHQMEVRLDRAQRKSELEDAIRKGCRAGMGSRENAPAEWIAKHLDAAMRKGQGKGTEAEFNALLDEIIALIGFTRDKDVFKAFYSTQLAKRLLLNKSASDDMERNMIVKLQQEMGEEFTSGDIMMKDLQLSDTLVKSYQTARAKNPAEYADAGDLTANVLTESAWPAYPQLKDGWNFKLAPELQSSIDAFTAWYGTQHRNRQLSWRPQLGTVTMSARFDSGKYEIGLSLFQAVVLLHFNSETNLDFNDIQGRTGIEIKELVRVLQSLSMGRKGTRVLLKKPAGKEVNPTDVFIWNKAFTSDRIKFKINQIQQDMTAEESKKTNEQVAIDRVSVLEATIVRIMKGRKKLTLQLLIDAVVSDVSKRFPPDVKEMKKRVESLIEREFLMRDEDDRNLLHYLA